MSGEIGRFHHERNPADGNRTSEGSFIFGSCPEWWCSRVGGHWRLILIQIGGGKRAGRGPSNVSMMIIRPPQHGHRRAGEGVSVSLSALASRFEASPWAAASNLARALDVARSNRSSEQAVVADAMKAARQHVQEKVADELGRVERHLPEPVW